MHTPNIRKRVEALSEIQNEHDEMKTKFFEERAKLEVKFQEKCKQLYEKRSDIVSGVYEVHGEVGKGVPSFWLNAMKTNEELAKEITKRDEGPLTYLKDIKWCRIDSSEGFKLDFHFDANPYFGNAKLTKTYHVTLDDGEPILQKIIGTEIDWKYGMNVTREPEKKKRKQQEKTKRKRQLDDCESFFNFFKSSLVPEDDYDLDKEAAKEQAKELQNKMGQDYDVGSTIRDKIIPHAVSWFTGEAVQVEHYYEEDDTDDYQVESYEENDRDDTEMSEMSDTEEAEWREANDKKNDTDDFQAECPDPDESEDDSSVDSDTLRGKSLLDELLADTDNNFDYSWLLGEEIPFPSEKITNVDLVVEDQTPPEVLGVLEKLTPNVRKRIQLLRELQTEHDEIKTNFLEEMAKLEDKYQKKYEPLHNKRFDIVNGTNEDEAEAEKDADKDAHVEKCVPEFWLTAMKKNKVLAKEITEKDEGPLKHLKDIKCSRTGKAKGFKLSFYFDDDNPYFHNAVLTKIYRMTKPHPMFDELILRKIQATKIEWKYGKNFTWEQVGKKLKRRSDYWASENWTMNIRINKSFFNIFNALVPDVDNLVPDDDKDFEETIQELQNEINQDYLVGCTIRDQIIPHAVSWFTRSEEVRVE